MRIEQQVTSLELSKRLKELGVEQESLFIHTRMNDARPYQVTTESEASSWKYYDFEKTYSAFTVAELGEMLPRRLKYDRKDNEHWIAQFRIEHAEENPWTVTYMCVDGVYAITEADTEADARAKMLIYLIENNLIIPPKRVEL